jgi:hypothetical protein
VCVAHRWPRWTSTVGCTCFRTEDQAVQAAVRGRARNHCRSEWSEAGRALCGRYDRDWTNAAESLQIGVGEWVTIGVIEPARMCQGVRSVGDTERDWPAADGLQFGLVLSSRRRPDRCRLPGPPLPVQCGMRQ